MELHVLCPLMKLCCIKWENMNFEHIITYFLVEEYKGARIRDNTVWQHYCSRFYIDLKNMILEYKMVQMSSKTSQNDALDESYRSYRFLSITYYYKLNLEIILMRNLLPIHSLIYNLLFLYWLDLCSKFCKCHSWKLT